MDLSCRTTRLVFEGAEAAGIPRDRLAGGHFDLDHLMNVRRRVDWSTMARLLERLEDVVSGDAEQIRVIGSHMVRAPSYDFMQRLGKNLVSPRSLYEAGERWVAPAMFPHVLLRADALPDGRMHYVAEIPRPYLPSAPFFYIFEGILRELPRILGLPRTTIDESVITPRTADLVFTMPRSQSLLERSRRTLKGVVTAQETVDLLERQRVELESGFETLKRATEEFRALLDWLPDAVVIHHEGNILWTNRALLRLLGYEREEDLVGQSLAFIVDATSHDVLRVRAPPVPPLTEVRLRRRDGEIATVEITPTADVSFGGRPARIVVARDVSERLQMQQRLVTADRLASLGMLAAGVAHEINNPIAYVLGSVEIVSKELARLDQSPDSRAGVAVAIALEGIARVRAIVRDLRMLSRADDRTVQPIDVCAVLDSTLALAGLHVAAGSRIVRDYGPIPAAHANAARLGQVFLNLIVNALEAMSVGATGQNELRLRTYEDDAGNAVIEVSDTGPGIAPDALEHVFDPFFTTKPVGKGTGLGLAICHQLVKELRGEISVVSTLGLGTTFRVALPATN